MFSSRFLQMAESAAAGSVRFGQFPRQLTDLPDLPAPFVSYAGFMLGTGALKQKDTAVTALSESL